MKSCSMTFLGAAETVTGSRHLLQVGGRKILIDCGLFQGGRKLDSRNRKDPGFAPSELDAIVISHAHIDHCGFLPWVTKHGFRGPVYCTPGTQSLLKIMLPDAAHIQVEDAAYFNRKHRNGPKREPLYTPIDAVQALSLVQTEMYGETWQITNDVHVTFRRAGHILGSANVQLSIENGPTVAFSGDVGRWNRPMIRDPEPIPHADYLLVESTYGNRLHPVTDARERLAEVINHVVERRGALLIPAFAVGRTQELIWRIRELEDDGLIPSIPVYIDSPMATDATEIFCQHPEDHDIDMKRLMDQHRCPLCCRKYVFTRTPEESKALNSVSGPLVIIAASGMITGGRILHHLKRRLSNPSTTVLMVGYQAHGTRGRRLLDGVESMKIHGETVPVRARVEMLSGLSAHADQSELVRWLSGFDSPPRQTFIVHGEEDSAIAFRNVVRQHLGWDAVVASDRQTVAFDQG